MFSFVGLKTFKMRVLLPILLKTVSKKTVSSLNFNVVFVAV